MIVCERDQLLVIMWSYHLTFSGMHLFFLYTMVHDDDLYMPR
jgi:hypothetical protein